MRGRMNDAKSYAAPLAIGDVMIGGVVAEVDVRPRNVVVLEPGMIPKTPSGKLRRASASVLLA